MSGLMKPTQKFVPINMLVKNKKIFQRALLVFQQIISYGDEMTESPKDNIP